MTPPDPHSPASLFDIDETAWLEATAELLRQGRLAEIDVAHLAEYLLDMTQRDRREVRSRFVVLLAHLLKWDYQADRRSGSWPSTILAQQRELKQLLDSATLKSHAISVLAEAFADARKEAAAETGLSRESFPEKCSWDLDAALADQGEE